MYGSCDLGQSLLINARDTFSPPSRRASTHAVNDALILFAPPPVWAAAKRHGIILGLHWGEKKQSKKWLFIGPWNHYHKGRLIKPVFWIICLHSRRVVFCLGPGWDQTAPFLQGDGRLQAVQTAARWQPSPQSDLWDTFDTIGVFFFHFIKLILGVLFIALWAAGRSVERIWSRKSNLVHGRRCLLFLGTCFYFSASVLVIYLTFNEKL